MPTTSVSPGLAAKIAAFKEKSKAPESTPVKIPVKVVPAPAKTAVSPKTSPKYALQSDLDALVSRINKYNETMPSNHKI